MGGNIKIKPIHLTIFGFLIIILGILIPSFFINAFSTIGLSLVIGLLIIVTAYILFFINTVIKRGKSSIKWLLIPIILIVISVGTFYLYGKYQQSLKDKIYSANETIEFKDFYFNVTKYEFKDIDLLIDKDFTSKHNINQQEDCSVLSTKKSWTADFYQGSRNSEWTKSGLSDSEVCNENNKSLKVTSNYLSNNKSLAVNYKILTKNTISSKNIKITLMADSGRNLDDPLDELNVDGRWIYKKVNETHQGITRETYGSSTLFPIYRQYKKFDIGGDINKGIARSGSAGADIRNEERVVDIKISYQGESRIMRISK